MEDHPAPAGQRLGDPGYLRWKTAKIEQGLAEAEDRTSLIPADKVWEDLGFER